MRLNESAVENPLLTVENLEIDFELFDGPTEAIDGASFSVDKGEVVTIASETGCGRSAAMESILRLLNQPSTRANGDITFDGAKLLLLSDREFKRTKDQQINLVFQDSMSSLNSTSTIGEQLTDTAQFSDDSDTGVVELFRRRFSDERDEVRKCVLEILHEVQMSDPESAMGSCPSQLSGGMRQHALIVQVLLDGLGLLIADEIGTALDVMVHDQTPDLPENLIENYDLSVLIITHNLDVARQVSDRVYIMYGGHIVETAPTDELFENLKCSYTQGFIASTPRLTGDGMVTGIDGSILEYFNPPSGCWFASRCPYATIECGEARPEMCECDPQTGIGCVLYDEIAPASKQPTVEETRSHMTRRPGKQTRDD